MFKNFSLGYEVIHACKYDYFLFWKENEAYDMCRLCGESRYKFVIGKGKKYLRKYYDIFFWNPDNNDFLYRDTWQKIWNGTKKSVLLRKVF